MLKFLWLNHNKITRITCLSNNWQLSELYLNNNEICDITGCLKHLTSLHTLLLNNNRLANLQATATELKGMTNLQILSLFNNPLAQESSYRPYIIHYIPSVQRLDRQIYVGEPVELSTLHCRKGTNQLDGPDGELKPVFAFVTAGL
ncbi:hypothetical protein XENTR_v10016082 [Xenopus tropicalis]|nr:hypothetical protein XENTR_v10016082 [Xenopus tropicalis]